MRGEAITEEVALWGRTCLQSPEQQYGTNGLCRADESVPADNPSRLEQRLRIVERGSGRAGDFPRREDVGRDGGGASHTGTSERGAKDLPLRCPGRSVVL